MKPIDIIRANRRGRRRRPALVRERRGQEVKYRRMVLSYVRLKRKEVMSALFSGNNPIIRDNTSDDITQLFRNLRAQSVNDGTTVSAVVRTFTNQANQRHRNRFYTGLERSYGVDVSGLVSEENLEDILQAAIEENVSLIKSIPNEYYDKVEQALFRHLASGGDRQSLRETIGNLGDLTESRIKLIARDQNSKLNSRLNKARQEALGVEEYVWVTSRDERVRQSHRDNNGKTFRWDDPNPDTGHPGEDIQCRCIAQPVLNL